MSSNGVFEKGTVQPAEAASRLGVSRTLIYKWMTTGKLPYIRVPDSEVRLIPVREIEAMLSAGLVGGAAAPAGVSS